MHSTSRLDADLAGKALKRVPVGAVIHQREVEAELQRNALALILRVEGGAERLIGPVRELVRLARPLEAAGMPDIEIVVHGDHRLGISALPESAAVKSA